MSVQLRGRVIERGTRNGLPGLRVQAWQETAAGPAGEAGTGDLGAFTLTVDTGDREGTTACSFRVLRGDTLLRDTGAQLVWTSEQPDAELVIEIDPPQPVVTQLTGRLTGRGEAPLPRLMVELRAGNAGAVPLGAFGCDDAGQFPVWLGDDARDLTAVVRDPSGAALADAQVQRRRNLLRVTCDLAPAARVDPSLAQAADVLGADLPAEYLDRLAAAGITTLGEFGRAADEVVEPDGAPAAVPALRTAAGLRTLTEDLALIRALTSNRYPTLGAIVQAPAKEFAHRLADRLDPDAAATLQASARAQQAYLGSLIAGERSAARRPAEAPRNLLLRTMPSMAAGACACSDCESAVSPAAYLADLLAYTVDHVTRAGQPLTLSEVIDLTLQPLRKLPLDCDAVDTTVPRLRIVVEVLRAHLAAEWATVPQDRRDALAAAERTYRSTAYQRLLAEHGTSFEELRGARIASAADRAALAERLGLDLVAPDPLADLLLDPNATPAQLTEAALQQLFGYQDTTGDPLADVPAGLISDRRHDRQRRAWLAVDHPADGYSFEREPQQLPSIDPDLVGPVDFRDQNPNANPCFQLYNARRAWVDGRLQQLQQDLTANGVAAVLAVAVRQPAPDYDALAADLAGTPAAAEAARKTVAALGFTAEAFNRLLEIRAAGAAAPPPTGDLDELAAILTQAEKVRGYPQWVQDEATRDVRLDLGRFRLVDAGRVAARDWLGPREGRLAWQAALRRRSAGPVVDPVLLGPVDLRDPSPSAAPYQLWDARRQFVAARIAQYGGGTPGLTLLENRIRTVLDELPAPRWRALADRYSNGAPLTEELAMYTITRPELGRLVRLWTALSSGLPVADPEWQDAAQVLARVVTRRQASRWRSEERAAGIVIGPDDFVLAGLSSVTPPPLLGSMADRSTWQDVLRARIEEDEAVRTAAAAAVQAAEEESLPLLRDALVAASTVPLTDPARRADWLADRLLIDVLTGTADRTTRVAQAIESLQVLLFSLRTGQLADTNPDLELEAEHFDEEWEWIGGYATWRAAMFVFLYPENLLLPSLRRHQTYGHRQLVAGLRSGRRTTPDRALEAVRDYLRYLDDVRSLRVEAVAVAGSGSGPSAREYTYLFGQSELSGAVYWSRDDASGPPGRTQSSWAPIIPLASTQVSRVIGACRTTGFGPDWLYLIVQTLDPAGPKLGFTRLSLEHAGSLVLTQDSGWSEFQELDLPDGATGFTAVLVHDQYADWPELAIYTQDGRFFIRRVVDTDWAGDDWVPVNLRWTSPQLTLPQTDLETLLDVVHVNGWGWLVFARYRTGMIWALFVATYQGLRSVRAVTAQAQRWQGVLSIDDTTQPANPNYPLAGTTRAYAFWTDGPTCWYQSFGVAISGIFSVVQSSNSWLDPDGRLATSGGRTSPDASSGSRVMVAFRRGGPFQSTGWNEPGQYLTSVRRLGVDSVLVEGPRQHVAPRLAADDVVQIGELQRDPQRRGELDNRVLPNLRFWWDRGANAVASNRDYLQEAYGFVPLHVALALQQRREYVAALDWFRVVYDYTAPAGSRAIYPGLVDEMTLGVGFDRAADWLLDTMNPHAVAETRRGSYTRSTVLFIVRCLLESGDDLFTTDVAESIARARVQYDTALHLLDTDELRQDDDGCEDLIGQVDVTVGGPEWVAILSDWARSLLGLSDRTAIGAAVAAVNEQLHADVSWSERIDGARAVVQQALAGQSSPTAPEAVDSQLRQTELAQRALLRSPDVEGMLIRLADVTTVGVPKDAFRMTGHWAPAPHFGFCVVPNPIPRTLRLWAELNLFKIRTSRNIAGLERAVEAYAGPTDTTSGLPSIGAGGQLSVPGVRNYRPTPYRYPQLIARAKELAELARQVEASMLAAIQAGDVERYTRLKARQDLAIGRAGIRLQTLRTTEATSGVKLAELTKQRASISVDHYTDLIEEGASSTEQAALVTLGVAAGLHAAAAVASAVAAGIQGSYAAALSSNYVTAATAPPVWAAMSSSLAASASSVAAGLQTVSSLLSMQAGFERRMQEWEFQRSLAAQDLAIADQQIQVAQDHVRVVAQEREIAQLTADNAEQTIDFLDNKFSNVELYDFMAGELERVYATVLEQAAATAQLASDQLAFERQEDPPAFIRADYWQPSTDGGAFTPEGDGGGSPDRRGLTGSARLLGDLVQLDGYAFDTDRRKLHLTTTMSLAQLAPVEFARFRQTGELTFDTPMEWFDQQFPGHYLRLIRRVRLSVIALIPPAAGIRATLGQSGPSYVVIGGPSFSRVKVRGGGFGEVALSSPFSDTGVFELDPQPLLRFPFEGSGLDTRWTLRLPRAANPFDFATIGDVMLTVEYTALSDANLRTQVIAGMRSTNEVTLPLSLRSRYPDQWYQLHNRLDRTPPFRISLDVSAGLLPPQLKAVQLAHVALLLAHDDGELPEPITVDLLGRPSGSGVTGTGATVPVTGLASSRSNAQGWNSLPRDPVGTWVLQFADERATRDLFDSGKLNDVMLALTLSGRPHPWV